MRYFLSDATTDASLSKSKKVESLKYFTTLYLKYSILIQQIGLNDSLHQKPQYKFSD